MGKLVPMLQVLRLWSAVKKETVYKSTSGKRWPRLQGVKDRNEKMLASVLSRFESTHNVSDNFVNNLQVPMVESVFIQSLVYKLKFLFGFPLLLELKPTWGF